LIYILECKPFVIPTAMEESLVLPIYIKGFLHRVEMTKKSITKKEERGKVQNYLTK